MRSAEGSGRNGASKLGAIGGGSTGSSAGAIPDEAPTFCPGAPVTGAVAFGCAVEFDGFVVVPGWAVPAGVAVVGCPPAGFRYVVDSICGVSGRGAFVFGAVCCCSC